MDADGGREHGMAFSQFDGGAAGWQAEARDQDMGDSGLGGAFQNVRPVEVEIFQIQMAVRVGQVQVSGCPVSSAPDVEDP